MIRKIILATVYSGGIGAMGYPPDNMFFGMFCMLDKGIEKIITLQDYAIYLCGLELAGG